MKPLDSLTSPQGLTWQRLCTAAVSALSALTIIFLSGCAQTGPATAGRAKAPTAASRSAFDATGGYRPEPAESAPMRESRPGLGTGWGEERSSYVSSTSFTRSNGNQPTATGRIFYNDRTGVDAMMEHEGGRDRGAARMARMASGLVSIGLKDGSGRWLDSWWAGGSRFVAGEQGDRYEIVLRNETGNRVEAMLSVDGLDVMDGRSASFKKRGYIVHPHDTVTVDGFRTSSSTVAAFRFSRVDRSYAALKHGDTRNVGVIGVAVFTERDPEDWRRRGANPFPGSRWAAPPEESRN